jgi:thermolysin
MRRIARGALFFLLVGVGACTGETIHRDHALQRPHVVVGEVVLQPGDDAPQKTLRFLEDRKAAIKMRAPGDELVLEREERDELGMKHVRFQQVVKGIPVGGAELSAHYDAEGRAVAIDANYVPNLEDLDVEAKIEERAAAAIARAEVNAPDDVEIEAGRLIIHADDDHEPKLAYVHTVRDFSHMNEPALWIVTVDAQTGDVLDRYNNIQTVDASGKGVLGDTKKFQVSMGLNGFDMKDASSGVMIQTLNAGNEQKFPGVPISSLNLGEWDRASVGAGAAVDAHVYGSLAIKYYKDRHQRNSIDGVGGQFSSTVHYGNAYQNAFYSFDTGNMVYGDGTDRAFSAGYDVVVHEMSHGVTHKTSDLVYKGQSGALNEAFSDIMAAFAEHLQRPDPVKNWTVGEDLYNSGKPFRDMADPNKYRSPEAMSQFVNTQQDEGGVHTNSGIINKAAYLITVGGNVAVTKMNVPFGIGWDKSEKLWYRANTKYWMQSTNFSQAAQGMMQAAKDIGLTANETAIVDCAWKAVGVMPGTCGTITDPNAPAPADPKPVEPTETRSPTTDTPAPEAGEQTPAEEAPKRRKAVAVETSGCNVCGDRSYGDPVVVFLAALIAVSLRRGARSREQL